MATRLASVVLPFYNQADHVEHVTERFLGAVSELPFEVEFILVPNNCSDGTTDICLKLARHHPRIRVVELAEGGWGRAVRAGIDAAEGELLCYTNSARTSTEMLVLSLLFASVHPDVVVKANRRVRDSLVRRLGSLIYNLECRMLFDLPQWDINGTPKVFPRSAASLRALQRNDDLLDLEFVARCEHDGHRILEVPLLATERHGGRSTTNLRSALRLYIGAVRMARAWERA